MPLSEDEERILKEMADNLYRDDPTLVSTLRTGQTRTRRNSIVLGVILSITGMAVLVLGVPTGIWLLGLTGFIMALTGVYLIFGYSSRAAKTPPAGSSSSSPTMKPFKGSGNSGFMDKVNRRWDDRRRQGGLE